MGDPLATYLHDHLAGSVHAVSLLEFIRDQHEREPLGRFASGLLAEIEADRHNSPSMFLNSSPAQRVPAPSARPHFDCFRFGGKYIWTLFRGYSCYSFAAE